jgi:hypothetical protein
MQVGGHAGGSTHAAARPRLTFLSPPPPPLQLTFIALLLCYWLIEWGLVKSNAQRGAITCARFYAPKVRR